MWDELNQPNYLNYKEYKLTDSKMCFWVINDNNISYPDFEWWIKGHQEGRYYSASLFYSQLRLFFDFGGQLVYISK